MDESNYQWPGLRKILPDVLAFVLGLGVAWKLGWNTTDLVWSLWLGSLVLGYLTILSTIAAGVYVGANVITHAEFPQGNRTAAILIGSVVAVFFLGFFALHFGAFHAVHAGILSGFFPLGGMPKNAFSSAFMNPVQLWRDAFHYVLPACGAFLVPAIIAERTHVFSSLSWAVNAVRSGLHDQIAGNIVEFGMNQRKSLHSPFVDPYINVIRMHLLIFFFALCHFLKVESVIVFCVVYFVYFFPWNAFRKEVLPVQGDARQMSSIVR
ncbi:MAG TPA: DUF6498-containing protein [Burkholderiales bacterium]|nr:DUF6498-containing protein [Burkholderiales bacterium]